MRGTTPKELPIPLGHPCRYLVYGSLVCKPNVISISSADFARLTLLSNRQTDRQTNRETDRHTDTDRQTDRQNDRQTDRPRYICSSGPNCLALCTCDPAYNVTQCIYYLMQHTQIFIGVASYGPCAPLQKQIIYFHKQPIVYLTLELYTQSMTAISNIFKILHSTVINIR